MEERTYVPTLEDVKIKPNEFINNYKKLANQSNLEFNRYKQDCRKRALDLAPSLITAAEPDVLKKADQLYKWLISIPE